MKISEIQYRKVLHQSDVLTLVALTRSTGYFNEEEVLIVEELVQETLNKPESGYCWLIGEQDSIPVGFTCYGRIAGSIQAWDLYWIVVGNSWRGQGIGKKLIRRTEQEVASLKGALLIAETSGKEQYADTRSFYSSCDYTLEATIKDFYAPFDDKLFYVKRL